VLLMIAAYVLMQKCVASRLDRLLSRRYGRC